MDGAKKGGGDGTSVVGFMAGLLVFVTALLAYNGLVGRHVRITQGPKRGPPTHVWDFTGSDAVRIGLGCLALSLGGAALVVMAIRKGRPPFGVRPSSAVFGVLASAGILAMIPPTGLTAAGFTAGFYGFLAPVLAGVLGRTPFRLALGVLLGSAGAALLGGPHRIDAFFSGALASAMLGAALLYAFDLRFESGLKTPR